MIKVFYSSCKKPFTDEKWNQYIKRVPVAIQKKINAFKRWEDRHASLIGKLLLMKTLKRAGYNNQLEGLKFNDYNRPYLDLPIDFNISHSENLVICALFDKGTVGVDVEAIKPIALHDFKNTMNEKEWETIHKSSNPLKEFYKYWTIKESVIKAHGQGLSINLRDLNIDQEVVMLYNEKWYVSELLIDEKYSSWIAYNIPCMNIELEQITF
ncbi:MAG: 4'-phosphopantetheinyl transferase superfamily protein [Bacteroidota bacterium]|nr:4'-phosphopantetheinyl transferase superfamily protein [Bacteroidota bacterium]